MGIETVVEEQTQLMDMRVRSILQITDALRVYDQYKAQVEQPLEFKPFLVHEYTRANAKGDSYAHRFDLYFSGQRHHANYGDVKHE